MPVVSLTLEDNNRSILSAAYYKIIQDVVNTINIAYGTLVVLHKDTEITLTDNRTNTSTQDKVNLPSTVAKRRIQATITEEYNEDALTTTAVHQPEAYPIFIDKDISVYIYPVYVKSDITLEFTYISPSKTEATRIRDDIRLRLSQTRNINIHEIDYSILIPQVVEDFIVDIYELKNRLVPQPLDVYFKEHSTKRIYPITDMSNEANTKLAINEKQVRILGLFDFSSMPEKIEVDNENNNYKFSFTYKLSMDVPRAIALRYPVMICNRLLPNKYISFIEEHKINSKQEYKKIEGYTSSAIRNLSAFEAHRQLEYRTDINLPINVPLFDDFNLRQGHRGYAIVASFLTDVNEENKKSLFNLKEIDPYDIPSILLEYIQKEELAHITSPYQSFFYLGLHQEDRYFDSDILTIDTNFNISAKKELSLFKPVRVTLSLCLDFSTIHPNAIKRLLAYPEILLLLLKEHIEINKHYKTEAQVNFIDNTFFRNFMDIIRYYLQRDNYEVIYGLLKIIQITQINEIIFGKSLYVGYNDLYTELNKKGILYIDKKTYKVTILYGNPYVQKFMPLVDRNQLSASNYNIDSSRASLELPIMKTVMTSGIIVSKTKDITE